MIRDVHLIPDNPSTA